MAQQLLLEVGETIEVMNEENNAFQDPHAQALADALEESVGFDIGGKDVADALVGIEGRDACLELGGTISPPRHDEAPRKRARGSALGLRKGLYRKGIGSVPTVVQAGSTRKRGQRCK